MTLTNDMRGDVKGQRSR